MFYLGPLESPSICSPLFIFTWGTSGDIWSRQSKSLGVLFAPLIARLEGPGANGTRDTQAGVGTKLYRPRQRWCRNRKSGRRSRRGEVLPEDKERGLLVLVSSDRWAEAKLFSNKVEIYSPCLAREDRECLWNKKELWHLLGNIP